MLANTVGRARSGLEIEMLRAARPITAGAQAKIRGRFRSTRRRDALRPRRVRRTLFAAVPEIPESWPEKKEETPPDAGPVLVQMLADERGCGQRMPSARTVHGEWDGNGKPTRITMS
jgi:hypothetical protein